MLHSTVMPKKSLSPTIEAMTITPFTNRYGASFFLKFLTGVDSQRVSRRRISSKLGAFTPYVSSVRDAGYALDERDSIIGALSGGTGVGARSICGTRPVSSAATTAPADGNL